MPDVDPGPDDQRDELARARVRRTLAALAAFDLIAADQQPGVALDITWYRTLGRPYACVPDINAVYDWDRGDVWWPDTVAGRLLRALAHQPGGPRILVF